MNWCASTVLITGGTGSFGRALAGTLLSRHNPRKVIIYSRDECKQHDMRTGGFDHRDIRYFIGDVRDVDRLRRAMQGVDVVVHAAALKQVPACEYNPIEAVATNINGSRCVIDAALDCHVPRVLALSTDKATAPLNLYGATKLVAEKMFVHANVYSGDRSTAFACVRYGNVHGSRGSVVPLFLEQRRSGRITITDPRMTRFWITLDQAADFVIECVQRMHGGEVFIPKLPSVRITDVARAVAPECRIDEIGIRPGEKLHEALLSEEEARSTVDIGDCYVMFPSDPTWSWHDWTADGQRLPDGFTYVSGSNHWWLSTEGIAALVTQSPCPGPTGGRADSATSVSPATDFRRAVESRPTIAPERDAAAPALAGAAS